MFYRLARVISLGESLSEELVRLNLFLSIVCLLAEFEEPLTMLNGPIQFSLRLINHADLLVTLSLNLLVFEPLCHCQTFFEKLERHVEVVHFEEFVRNKLVHADEVN